MSFAEYLGKAMETIEEFDPESLGFNLYKHGNYQKIFIREIKPTEFIFLIERKSGIDGQYLYSLSRNINNIAPDMVSEIKIPHVRFGRELLQNLGIVE